MIRGKYRQQTHTLQIIALLSLVDFNKPKLRLNRVLIQRVAAGKSIKTSGQMATKDCIHVRFITNNLPSA